ncbi:MAG: TlpA disulfide reductase family protein [Fimbriimonas sp.]|nr:TlpA disulfide reductase family protein [Fimbriimonas sp.]
MILAASSCAPDQPAKPVAVTTQAPAAAADTGGSIAPVPIGNPAPDFTVTSFDGKPTKLSELRGHPVLIDYWATWCPPCIHGLPHTQAIFKAGSPQGLKVMTICDQDLTPVKSLFKANGYTFPAFVDTYHEMGPKYNIDVIPVEIVIDAKGNLVDYLVGDGQEQILKADLAKLGVKV